MDQILILEELTKVKNPLNQTPKNMAKNKEHQIIIYKSSDGKAKWLYMLAMEIFGLTKCS